MNMRLATSHWIALLSTSSLLLATVVSLAIIDWMPRPAPPRMSLDVAVKVMKGEAPPGPIGLKVLYLASPPVGKSDDWLTKVAALHLGQPITSVRLVWNEHSRYPSVQIVESGDLLESNDSEDLSPAETRALSATELPPFDLAVATQDGRWRVVRSNHNEFSAWRRQVMMSLSVGALLLAPLTIWASIRVGRPLKRLAEESAKLDLSTTSSLPSDGPLEVQILSRVIRDNHERLQKQAMQLTSMLAAVAHDLRTPLTSLRLRAELSPRTQSEKMAYDIGRMEAMIQQVLDYARGELEPIQFKHFDFSTMLEECLQEAVLRGVQISMDTPRPLPWVGDELALRRAVENLIDNAERYAGSVELLATKHRDRLQLDVMDRGPGVTDTDRVRLLQPFQRCETSRSRATGGAGLGLAVVATVARRHGGELLLLPRNGGGLIARLVLVGSSSMHASSRQ